MNHSITKLLTSTLILLALGFGTLGAAPTQAAPLLLINEILFNPPGADAPNEYIELRGSANGTLPAGTYLVGIEGDSSGGPGDVQDIFNLSGLSFGSNGYLVLRQNGSTYSTDPNANVLTATGTGWGTNNGSWTHSADGSAADIENASVSFLLINSSSAPALSNDIDSNNDGTADGTVYAGWTVYDSVNSLDNSAAGDFGYGAPTFFNSAGAGAGLEAQSVGFTPGYLARRAGDTSGHTAADWVAGDSELGSVPNFTLGTSGNTFPVSYAGAALNHIGSTNFPALAPSATPTSVATNTPTNTLTPIAIITNTATFTPTDTATLIDIATPTDTATWAPTPDDAATNTATPLDDIEATLTSTPTTSPVGTESPTDTATSIASPLGTDWATWTLAPSDTTTNAATPADAETWTPAPADAATSTATQADTETWTPAPADTATNTVAPTDTATFTPTSTKTATKSSTPTKTATKTLTPTKTTTKTPTSTNTAAPTGTTTFTPTLIASPVGTDTATNTAVPIASPVGTNTATWTPLPTDTATETMTPTDIVTFTLTPTYTATPTRTSTPVPVTVTLNSIGVQDGWVLESSEIGNVGGALNSSANYFLLGDSATRKQYRGILSFSTGSLPDNATITGVMLKVKRIGIGGGGNPLTIFQGFMADIKNGFFGTSALQLTDFQTASSGTYGPFSPTPAGNIYSINLIDGAANINKLATNGGLTQIRLRFKLDDNNNTVANYLSLYSGNATAAADRPQLVLTYTTP